MRRRCIWDATVTVTAKNLTIKGVDITTLTLKSFPNADMVLANNIFENMICGTINNNTQGDKVVGLFFDVHADSFLQSDTATDVVYSSFIMCGGIAFRSGISTYASSIWTGGLKNSYFDNCWGRTASFAGGGGYAYQTKFYKCTGTNNCFGTIEACTLDKVVFGDTCVVMMDGGKIQDTTGGVGCVADFTNSAVIKDSDFGINFGRTGGLSYVWGLLDNVRSDFSTTGFCNNRNWYGKMRRMFIRSSVAATPALTVYTPTILSVLQQPATIEQSTILACFNDTTAPIVGSTAYVSYCKFNKEISVTNVLGTDAVAHNIVNADLCNYVPSVCPIPTSFLYTSGTLYTGAPITFVFSYQMSASRAGSQIQMTDPTGQVSLINYVGNDGGATTGTKNIPVTTPIAGAYTFKLHTVCAYDGGGHATDVSSWTATVVANVTVPVTRATAWEAQVASKFCLLGSLSPTPLYVKIDQRNPQVLNNYIPAPGAGNYYTHTETDTIDLYAMFYSDPGLTIPVTLAAQSLVVYVKSKETDINNVYSGTNTFPDSTTNIYSENVLSYALTSISGTECLLAAGMETLFFNEETNDHTISGVLVPYENRTTDYEVFPSGLVLLGRTGQQGWNTLEQYYTDDHSLTGLTKANSSLDPDYVAPDTNLTDCSVSAPTTLIGYGLELLINKLQLTTGSSVVVPSHSDPYDTGAGGNTFMVRRFVDQPTVLVVNINSYYGGHANVTITVDSDAGAQLFSVPRNIETNLGTFVNITQIRPSNF